MQEVAEDEGARKGAGAEGAKEAGAEGATGAPGTVEELVQAICPEQV